MANTGTLGLDLSRDAETRERFMRWYQDTRGFDSLFSIGHGIYGGSAGSFYALENNWNDSGTPILLRYISRFHDQGAPENKKTYQDLVIEHNTQGSGLTVKALLDNGQTSVTLGTILSTSRTQTPFRISGDEGARGKNFAILIEGNRLDTTPLTPEIFDATLHYYIEPRDALTWDSDELDLGMQQVKAFRAVDLDIHNPGEVTVQVWTDMPGNAMTLRSTKTVPASTTRRKYQVPLGRPYLEGRHVRVIILSPGTTTFQLYGARMEFQPFGEYVEGYESTAGREWDSGTLDLGDPRVKEVREVQLDVDTDGALTFDFHTDLPGMNLTSRVTKSVNTEPTTTGRRMVNLPLQSDSTPYEGHLVRSFLRGTAAWRLYGAWLFARPIGYYVESYQATDGHLWDSTVLDLGTPQVKRLLELSLDAHADSPLTIRVYASDANGNMYEHQMLVAPASIGRKPYIVPLTRDYWNRPHAPIFGRLFRVTISSTGAFRLYGVRAKIKPIGVFLNASSDEVFLVETEQDLASERVKLFKEIEAVYDAGAAGTVDVYTDGASGGIELVRSFALPVTSGTQTTKLRLPPTAKGRLLRAEVRPGTGDLALFGMRLWSRVVGEAGKMGWSWISLPVPQTPDNYAWVDLYVAPTPPAWAWTPIYVPPTVTEKWAWADLPVQP